MVVGALVSTEFSVLLKEGESLGAGEGLAIPDFSDTAVAAITGGLLGGVAGGGDILADLKGLSAGEGLLVKGIAGAGLSAGGSVTMSELDGKGVGDLTDILLAAALGGAGADLEGSLSAAQKTITRMARLGRTESEIAVDLAALYKQDPKLLTAVRDTPTYDDDLRYLAGQYRDLFASDPDILRDVPSVATMLKSDPDQVTHILAANREIAQIAHDVHMPPTVRNRLLAAVARPRADRIAVSFDGATDDVKDWVRAHREVMEELEEKLNGLNGAGE